MYLLRFCSIYLYLHAVIHILQYVQIFKSSEVFFLIHLKTVNLCGSSTQTHQHINEQRNTAAVSIYPNHHVNQKADKLSPAEPCDHRVSQSLRREQVMLQLCFYLYVVPSRAGIMGNTPPKSQHRVVSCIHMTCIYTAEQWLCGNARTWRSLARRRHCRAAESFLLFLVLCVS